MSIMFLPLLVLLGLVPAGAALYILFRESDFAKPAGNADLVTDEDGESEPELDEDLELPIPPPVNTHAIGETRTLIAQEMLDEAQRINRKISAVRDAMELDIQAMKRLRAEADLADAEARQMRTEKLAAERQLAEKLAELAAARESAKLSGERVDRLNGILEQREVDLALAREANARLEENYRDSAAAQNRAEADVTRLSDQVDKARAEITRLERMLFEREEELALQGQQIGELQAGRARQLDEIERLERRIGQLNESFEDARRDSRAQMEELRMAEVAASERTAELEQLLETVRRKLGETEHERERLGGQLSELRGENAALRAEAQIRLRELESLHAELNANNSVISQMMKQVRVGTAKPAPDRANLRVIAESKGIRPATKRA